MLPAVSVNGDEVATVKIDGVLVPYAHYLRVIEPAADAKQEFLALYIDPSAVARGHFMAFRNAADAEKYEAAHGMLPNTSRLDSTKWDAIRAKEMGAPAAQHLNGVKVQLAACPTSPYYAQLYDGLNCTGTMLSMGSTDIINRMSDYGFDNKTSSLWLGQCIVQLRLFTNTMLTGTMTVWGGGGQQYGAISSGNTASSASTPGANC